MSQRRKFLAEFKAKVARDEQFLKMPFYGSCRMRLHTDQGLWSDMDAYGC